MQAGFQCVMQQASVFTGQKTSDPASAPQRVLFGRAGICAERYCGAEAGIGHVLQRLPDLRIERVGAQIEIERQIQSAFHDHADPRQLQNLAESVDPGAAFDHGNNRGLTIGQIDVFG